MNSLSASGIVCPLSLPFAAWRVMVAEELSKRGEVTGLEQAGVFMTIEDVMAYLAMGVL